MKWLLLVAGLLTAQAAPQPAQVQGTVVIEGSGAPATRARVELLGVGSPGGVITMADERGRFSLPAVSAGTYRLRATRPGFAPTELGQRRSGLAGTLLLLAAGQKLGDLLLTMTPLGVIAGRVSDRYGEPMGNAMIQALQLGYSSDGRRVLNAVQSVRTNDIGEYRLFWLNPGRYVVTVLPAENLGSRGAASDGESAIRYITGSNGAILETYLPTYFPNTVEAANAIPIEVRSGQMVGGIDLSVAASPTVRVRGKITGGIPGQSARTVSVVLTSRTAGMMATSVGHPAVVTASGTFDLQGVVPGSYNLLATMSLPRAANALPSFDNGGPRYVAFLPLEVGTRDIDNLQVDLQTGYQISGRFRVEGASGASVPDLSTIRVNLQSDFPAVSRFGPQLAADGTFTILGVVAGDYRLQVVGIPRNLYSRSATLGSIDVLNGALILAGEPRGPLEIVLGGNPATLDIAVTDERQNPASSVTLVAVPDSPGRSRFDLYRPGITDAFGHIRLTQIVPGDYKVFAWEDVEYSAWMDPEFLRDNESRGVPVHLGEGGRASLTIQWIPSR